jgi:ribosomal protein S6E (S10)
MHKTVITEKNGFWPEKNGKMKKIMIFGITGFRGILSLR